METISRQQKIDHLIANPVPVQEFSLTHDGIRQRLTPATADKPGLGVDFQYWLTNSDEGRALQEVGTPLLSTMNAYGRAIEQEKERIESFIPGFREKFGKRLHSLTEKGHAPAVLYERFIDHGASTHVGLGVFDSYDDYATAIYKAGSHTVHFRPWRDEKAIYRSYVHESLHGLSGASSKLYRNQAVVALRTGLGAAALEHLPNNERQLAERHRAINEGVTEYLANITVNGLSGLITAKERGGLDSRRYMEEREIVGIIAKRIGLNTLLNAYAEDYIPGQPDSQKNTRQMVASLRKVYGPGFLNKLDRKDREKGVKAALGFVKTADKHAEANDKSDPLRRRQSRMARVAAYLGIHG